VLGACLMKYMGSKRAMLENGLVSMLRRAARDKNRIVDLFAGSASVAWFAAQNLRVPVIACDLQTYTQWLARSVIQRTSRVCLDEVERAWIRPALDRAAKSETWQLAMEVDDRGGNAGAWANAARDVCSATSGSGVIWRAYGGYYYSPRQAVMLDTLRRALPNRGPLSWVCQAALLVAASKCAAAPGHTAQPFATTRSAGPFLREAWLRDPVATVRVAVQDIGERTAKVAGDARVGDALQVARHLDERDLVFVDPPYSAVHYSRFYHVLETIARGGCGPVHGTGRYPPFKERPTSEFSQRTTSEIALERLFASLAARGCTTIVTFPRGKCSNGLSGKTVQDAAAKHFRIGHRYVKTKFSTLGGNGINRGARMNRSELMLVLRPK
jgi:adenine-specific DNA-methyltransferase